MRIRLHGQLLAIARREAGAIQAEDVVQESLLIAVEHGRFELDDPANVAWLRGVVRNRARMTARTGRRRLSRETHWHTTDQPAASTPPANLSEILSDLPPSLRVLAALIVTGHNRREIAYLLALADTALRQRISALKRHLAVKDLSAPTELTGLNLNLAYGRIRDALVPALHRHGGSFASHDPDGHLFIVRRSQNPSLRQ